ncbi:hypothetical protein THIAE_06755 [Thiomicrospira aerophila AL3]|uniref:Sel1 repeat family protein n=1 Tax=Thiomicrospira aerophila AL3 TaxID=717772 RepID=W0DS83_9GAMM|nr:tetratricopeptide repeat protein [Thiomicrospira aerophila]AHF01495.1 hypothetical protein THIAE_06755 [Thiomicrospira aerophila AL3]
MLFRSSVRFIALIMLIGLGFVSLNSQASTSVPTLSIEFHEASQAYALGDYVTAYKMFLPMAEQGNVFAQFALGQIYRFGQGREINFAPSLYWYQQAAKQEYGVAQSHLGEMYLQGLGTEPDKVQAAYWFNRACENRCSEGCKNLAALSNE